MNTPDAVSIPTDKILSINEVKTLLENDLTATRVLDKGVSPVEGELVGVRLNLNVMKTTKHAIQTLHKATNKAGYKRNKGFYSGEACGYAQAVLLKDAYFNVNQGGREAIASGKQQKFAMASIDGQLIGTQVPEDFTGVEVSFNPRAQHLFVDANNQAIHFAEEVVILGHRAYARGRIDYHTELSAPKRQGDFPSQTQVLSAPEMNVEAPRRSVRF